MKQREFLRLMVHMIQQQCCYSTHKLLYVIIELHHMHVFFCPKQHINYESVLLPPWAWDCLTETMNSWWKSETWPL